MIFKEVLDEFGDRNCITIAFILLALNIDDLILVVEFCTNPSPFSLWNIQFLITQWNQLTPFHRFSADIGPR